jgi:hypothetical protein
MDYNFNKVNEWLLFWETAALELDEAGHPAVQSEVELADVQAFFAGHAAGNERELALQTAYLREERLLSAETPLAVALGDFTLTQNSRPVNRFRFYLLQLGYNDVAVTEI